MPTNRKWTLVAFALLVCILCGLAVAFYVLSLRSIISPNP